MPCSVEVIGSIFPDGETRGRGTMRAMRGVVAERASLMVRLHPRPPSSDDKQPTKGRKTMDVSQATLSSGGGPARIGIHGTEGSRKTTAAAYLPAPVFVCGENGIPRDLGFSVPTLTPQRWDDVFDIVASLARDRHDRQSMIIDTVDWIEPLIHRFVCDRDSKRQTEMNPKGRDLVSIEDYGFGKGFLAAEEEFRRLIGAIDVMQAKRNIHVCLIMHSAVRTFKNPSGPDFDRYEPKCHARISAVIKEWVEHLLFFYYRIDASKISEDKERNKMSPDRARAKGVGGDEHVIGARFSAMYDAKNRARLPSEIVGMSDPNELIAQLLGDHLVDVQAVADRRDRADVSRSNDAQAAPMHPAIDRFRQSMQAQGHEPRDSYPEPDRASDDMRNTARGDMRNTARPPLSVVPPVPAHHETRKEDERARQDDAFARARGAVEERDARRSADPAKTDARTWTEPTRARRDDHPNAPAAMVDEHRMIAALTDAITRAERELGPRYRADVEGVWLVNARDPKQRPDIPYEKKVAAIIRKIDTDIAAKKNAAQPTG